MDCSSDSSSAAAAPSAFTLVPLDQQQPQQQQQQQSSDPYVHMHTSVLPAEALPATVLSAAEPTPAVALSFTFASVPAEQSTPFAAAEPQSDLDELTLWERKCTLSRSNSSNSSSGSSSSSKQSPLKQSAQAHVPREWVASEFWRIVNEASERSPVEVEYGNDLDSSVVGE